MTVSPTNARAPPRATSGREERSATPCRYARHREVRRGARDHPRPPRAPAQQAGDENQVRRADRTHRGLLPLEPQRPRPQTRRDDERRAERRGDAADGQRDAPGHRCGPMSSVASAAARILSSPGSVAVLEVLRVRHRHLRHPDALDRRVEVVEARMLHPRGDLRGHAVGRPALLDAQHAIAVRATDSAIVSTSSGRSERRSTTSASTSCSEASRSATASARTVANECDDDREVGALPRDLRAADGGGEVLVERDLALLLVDREVLDDEHGVLVADRRLQQPLGVARVRRRDDLEPRDVRRTSPRSSASAAR